MVSKKQRVLLFLEFVVFGVAIGIVEDLIAVMWATGASFSWKILVVITLVAIPFAALGEFVVDKTNFLPRLNNKNFWNQFAKFFVFGFTMGLAEDLLAVLLATNHALTWKVIGICALVTLPFAIAGEFFIDYIRPVKRRVRKAKRKTQKK